ncbi:unnamed protein product [Schistosoma guineensis]|nr:unnamed protein product [Schistosoma guineensis]
MSLRESINAIDLEEIHWFFVTVWFKSLRDVTAVSTAVCIAFKATSGSTSFSELPHCDLSCSSNLLLVSSPLSSVRMGLCTVAFFESSEAQADVCPYWGLVGVQAGTPE